jgi:hypothetical protein
MKQMKKLFPTICLIFLSALLFSVQAQTKQRVRFATGEAEATLRGSISGYAYKDYLVRAKAGQVLSVMLESEKAQFTVRKPNGANIDDAVGVADWVGELPSNGDYTIRVLMPRSAARRKGAATSYVLTVSVDLTVLVQDLDVPLGENSDVGSTVDPIFAAMMPTRLGGFTRKSFGAGEASKDFPGATKVGKSVYTKGSKEVTLVVAEFSSISEAKSRYGYFLDGFKSVGAKVLNSQKIKSSRGVETGDSAIYTYASVYEGMFYNDRYGSRITAPDLQTLTDFASDFSKFSK